MPLDVLIVEDDAALREILALHLRAEGLEVRSVERGDEALEACRARRPDIVLLDLALPGLSGLEVCRALRADGAGIGIVIVTSRATEVDVILGLEVGADDYVIKPCRPREIYARIRALERRLRREPERDAKPEPIERGPLRLDLAARRVTTRAGAELTLTGTEYALLVELARTPDVARSRAELLANVFDSQHEGYARNVDCHVTRIRRKLEAAGVDGRTIESVHGVGYRFAERAPT